MVKLSNKKIRWLVRNVTKGGVSTKDAATIYNITQRRAQQLVKGFNDTAVIPTLSCNRRPRTFLTGEQKRAIDKAWDEARLGARLLYYELRRRGHRIPKNKIHEYLTETGRSRPNPNKQKKRKRCRYERKHSLSLLHADWFEHNGKHGIAFEDDASRKILAIGEFDEATTENAIKVFKEVETQVRDINAYVVELNTDRGTQFYANKRDKRGRAEHGFEKYLESRGIRHVLSRRNNPQTNGKLERWIQEYKKHRDRFGSPQEFAEWYNNRLHGALWLEYAETPNEAFQRKMRPEHLLWQFFRLNGG